MTELKPMKGTNLKIRIADRADLPAIAMAKSVEIVMSCETREVANDGPAGARKFIPGAVEWEATVTHLVGNLMGKFDFLVGEKVMLEFYNGLDDDDVVRGEAVCVQSKVTATKGNLAQGSWKFKGSGWLGSWVY